MKYQSSYDDETFETTITREQAIKRIRKSYNNPEEVLQGIEKERKLLRLNGGYILIRD